VGKPARNSQLTAKPKQAGARHPAASGRTEHAKGALGLDRLIHERLRLGVISALAANDRLTFNELKRFLQTTDGNLSVHARKLEEAGYISCEKLFVDRVPQTTYRLTATGRRALDKYLGHMEPIIRAMR
jgi:DNA-binding MarR family transcriptional regulator